jgi:hypothetical protein
VLTTPARKLAALRRHQPENSPAARLRDDAHITDRAIRLASRHQARENHMRKLILISVLALASVTAQAGQQRGLVLASGDAPNSSERIESVNPEPRKTDVKPEAPRPARETLAPASSPAKQVFAPAKKQVFTPVKQASSLANRVQARGYENQEAEARRIAALYGVSW